MEFEWDDRKNRQNIAKHFISFEEATGVFESTSITLEDKRNDYGENRFITIGYVTLADGKVMLTVVYTWRNHRIRIISARKASKKEKALYYELIN